MYVRCIDPSYLVFSLSLYRHPTICILFNSRLPLFQGTWSQNCLKWTVWSIGILFWYKKKTIPKKKYIVTRDLKDCLPNLPFRRGKTKKKIKVFFFDNFVFPWFLIIKLGNNGSVFVTRFTGIPHHTSGCVVIEVSTSCLRKKYSGFNEQRVLSVWTGSGDKI